jgi:hypothetical protein
MESEGLRAMKARVTAAGGMWEQLFGGLVVVHVPRQSDLDPRAEIERVVRESGSGSTPPESGVD